MTWLLLLAALAVVVGTAYVHDRDRQTHTDDAEADAERDHRQAVSDLTVGGSLLSVLFSRLRKHRKG